MSDQSNASFEAMLRRHSQLFIEELLPRLQQEGVPLGPEWLSPRQASIYCGWEIKSLEQMRRQGGGPQFSKVGHLIRYRRADIDAWLVAGRVEPKGGAQ